MKRKKIEIMTIVFIVLCSIVLYVIETNKFSFFNKNSKDENKSTNVLKTENVANARDGIKGVTQPYPFITNPSGVENNLLQNANGSLIGQLIYLQRENLPEADKLGGTNVAIGGCGPTCVAMALSGILDDKSITPKNIAEKEDASGYFTDAGTKWSFFDYIAKEYGVKSTGVPLNKESMKSVLSKGNPIIASVHPGKFTTVGHIILITGVDNEGKFIINDPNSYTRTLKKWSYDELKTEIVAMWEFSK